MAKAHSPKVKGSVCDIPISEIDNNYNSFLRPENSNGVIIIELKRKVEYSWVYASWHLFLVFLLFIMNKLGSIFNDGDFDCSQPALTCSNLTIETLEQGVKYIQS